MNRIILMDIGADVGPFDVIAKKRGRFLNAMRRWAAKRRRRRAIVPCCYPHACARS